MSPTGVIIAQSHLEERHRSPSRHDVYRMFDRIARCYDLLNRLLSFGQDILWRKKLAKILEQNQCAEILDLASGTADVLLSAIKHNRFFKFGLGLDLSQEMLSIGRHKISQSGYGDKLKLLRADATEIPISDNSFDAITIAFGIRNVVSVDSALKEMKRVIKTGGKVCILEFSMPSNVLMRELFLIYLRHILPFIGGIISGDKKAYKYLNETVESFPYGQAFGELMSSAGLKDVRIHRLSFGAASIYEGTK